MNGTSVFAQGLIVLGCISIGVRMRGIAIGLWGFIGVFLLSTFFHLPPGNIPISAIGIIFTVVIAASAMFGAGGMDYLVGIAQRILKKHPRYITFLAPLFSYLFTIGAGTGNVYYSLLPVIEEISFRNKIRPERPLAIAPVASQLGITSSPVSSAMAIMIGLMEPYGFSLFKILLIVIPSTLIAILITAWIQNYRGEDIDFKKLNSLKGLKKKGAKAVKKTVSPQAKQSVFIFLSGVMVIVFLSAFSQFRPQIFEADSSRLTSMGMSHLIMLIMSIVSILILLITKTTPSEVSKTNLFRSGMISILALFGIAWMANTFISGNEAYLISHLENLAKTNLIFFALAIFIMAALTTSQSSTTLVLIPIGLTLGIEPAYLVAMWMALIGIYFFPANGSQIATIEFDRSKTVQIGRWVVNHSFMIPMLISAVISVFCGFLIAYFLMT